MFVFNFFLFLVGFFFLPDRSTLPGFCCGDLVVSFFPLTWCSKFFSFPCDKEVLRKLLFFIQGSRRFFIVFNFFILLGSPSILGSHFAVKDVPSFPHRGNHAVFRRRSVPFSLSP